MYNKILLPIPILHNDKMLLKTHEKASWFLHNNGYDNDQWSGNGCLCVSTKRLTRGL